MFVFLINKLESLLQRPENPQVFDARVMSACCNMRARPCWLTSWYFITLHIYAPRYLNLFHVLNPHLGLTMIKSLHIFFFLRNLRVFLPSQARGVVLLPHPPYFWNVTFNIIQGGLHLQICFYFHLQFITLSYLRSFWGNAYKHCQPKHVWRLVACVVFSFQYTRV